MCEHCGDHLVLAVIAKALLSTIDVLSLSAKAFKLNELVRIRDSLKKDWQYGRVTSEDPLQVLRR